jgi:nicotinamide mononucleotide adenylyltransferase
MDLRKLTLAVPSHCTPVVLVARGAFAPPTYAHLRAMEAARSAVTAQLGYCVIGGFVVCDDGGAVPRAHCVAMAELATDDSSWITVCDAAAGKDGAPVCAAACKDDTWIEAQLADVEVSSDDDSFRAGRVRVMPVCLGIPPAAAATTVGAVPPIVFARHMDDMTVGESARLAREGRLLLLPPLGMDACSPAKVRECLQRGVSIKYLVPDAVRQYLYSHKLLIF